MKKRISLYLCAFAILTLSASAEVLHYTIDPVHSGVSFKVRHFLNKIPGTFTSFQGEIHFDTENPANSKTVATIDVKSVDTRNEKRDGHLQADDYFNAGEFPTIEFTSTEWIATGDNTFTVKGILKILGKENPIEMEVSYLGEMEARGKIRSGWEGKTTIDRSVWGLDNGKPVVGMEVDIELNIQAHR